MGPPERLATGYEVYYFYSLIVLGASFFTVGHMVIWRGCAPTVLVLLLSPGKVVLHFTVGVGSRYAGRLSCYYTV